MSEFSGVSHFLAEFKGGARPNRFQIDLVAPSGITLSQEGLRNFRFLCFAGSIPASIMGYAQVTYMGNLIKVAGDRSFEDWTVQIYSDTSWKIRTMFERWSAAIMGHTTGIASVQDANEYFGKANITPLDRNEAKIGGSGYFLSYLFPVFVGPLVLDYNQRDQVQTFEVTFAVNMWQSDHTLDGGAGAAVGGGGPPAVRG